MKTTTTPTTYYVDYEFVSEGTVNRERFAEKERAKKFLQSVALNQGIRVVDYNFVAKITSINDVIADAIESGAQLGLTPKVSLSRSISRLCNKKHLCRNGSLDKYIELGKKIAILNQELERLVRVEEQGCAQ
jgi:hypothetical protein